MNPPKPPVDPSEEAKSFFQGDVAPAEAPPTPPPSVSVPLPPGFIPETPVRPEVDIPRDKRFDTPISDVATKNKAAVKALLRDNLPPEVTAVSYDEKIQFVAAMGLGEDKRFHLDLQPIRDAEGRGTVIRIRDRTFFEDDLVGAAARAKIGDPKLNIISALTWTTRYSLAVQLMRIGDREMNPFTADPDKPAGPQVEELIATYERMFNKLTMSQGHLCFVAGLLFTMKINALELGCVRDDFFKIPICALSIEPAHLGS